jgi:FkbM family methyltransferase
MRKLYPRRLGLEDGYEYLVRSQTGSLFSGVTGDYHAHRFGVHGYSGEWRLWAIARAVCREGDTIVEVGAQVGTETIGYSDLVGRSGKVIAFEPSPANYAALQAALAKAQYANVTMYPYALADFAGEATFAVPPSSASTGIGHLLGPAELRTGTSTYYGDPIDASVISIEVRTLDSFADEIERVSFLACDAEGSELRILRGARTLLRRDRPPLVLEASPLHLERSGSGVEELHEELVNLEYRVFEIGALSLAEVQTADASRGHRNWCCLHEADLDVLPKIRRLLWTSAFLPCVPGLNPLSRRPVARRT